MTTNGTVPVDLGYLCTQIVQQAVNPIFIVEAQEPHDLVFANLSFHAGSYNILAQCRQFCQGHDKVPSLDSSLPSSKSQYNSYNNDQTVVQFSVLSAQHGGAVQYIAGQITTSSLRETTISPQTLKSVDERGQRTIEHDAVPPTLQSNPQTIDADSPQVGLSSPTRANNGVESQYRDLIKTFDWSQTSLGPITSWPASIRTVVNTILALPSPMCLYYGNNLVALPNWHYTTTVAQQRPPIIGLPFSEAFPEAVEQYQFVFEQTKKGISNRQEKQLYFLSRTINDEEVYFDTLCAPITDENGHFLGALNQAIEVTYEVIQRRTDNVLYSLSSKTPYAKEMFDNGTFWSSVLESFDEDEFESPIVAIYSAGMSTQDGSNNSSRTHETYEFVGGRGLPEDFNEMPFSTRANMSKLLFRTFLTNPVATTGLSRHELSPKDVELFQSSSRGYKGCLEVTVFPLIQHNGKVHSLVVLGLNQHRPFDGSYVQWVEHVRNILTASVDQVSLMNDEIDSRLRLERAAIKIREAEMAARLSKTTKDLKDSEKLFAWWLTDSQTAAAVPIGLSCLDKDGTMVWCNDAQLSLLGTTRESMDDWESSIHPDDLAFVKEKFTTCLRDQSCYEFEFRTTSRWCRTTMDPNYDEDGQFTGYFGTLVDIDLLKKAQEYERQLTTEARERKRQQDYYIDVNPLSAIIQSADEIQTLSDNLMYSTKTNNDDLIHLTAINEAAKTILACGEHQRNIIDDILTVSKMDAGLLKIERVPVRPFEVLNNGMRMFAAEFRNKGITASIECTDSFKTLCKADQWCIDPSRLNQILINLLTNAIKFTAQREGAREVNVSIDATKERPLANMCHAIDCDEECREAQQSAQVTDGEGHDAVYITVKVQDTGIGISQEWQMAIGQRFQQAPKTHISYGGSGLGLFIASQLSKLLGGELFFESELGKGSTFSFFIHALRSLAQIDSHIDANSSSSSTTTITTSPTIQSPNSKPKRKKALSRRESGAGYKVLVVEDNLLNQKILQKQLVMQGCSTYVANNGLEAVRQMEEGLDVTVILMDMEMPVMDGLTATRQIRALEQKGDTNKYIPIIGTSANARREQIESMMDAGMDGAITKPFLIKDLMVKIESVLDVLKPGLHDV